MLAWECGKMEETGHIYTMLARKSPGKQVQEGGRSIMI
jgi:hypothetical protein